jgi:hypothetical protein
MTFIPIPTNPVRYNPSPVFVSGQLRRGMLPALIKWRYYNPCSPGYHRWRLTSIWMKRNGMRIYPLRNFRVCESCCRWTQ